jgi:hypothetical protein
LILISHRTGWVRHNAFGLRREWLDLYFADLQGWDRSSNLGNRQVESLKTWLKTAGIEDENGHLTELGERCAAEGTACLYLWELLWVNVVFNFPTACWYVHLGNGEWTTTELKAQLRAAVPRLAEWTASNAIMELAGLLERTPVGGELGQGYVQRGRPRRLIRRGIEPCDVALIHALGRLYLQHDQTRIAWNDDLTWPWVVFGCSRQFVLERLTILDQNHFDIDEQGIIFRTTDREWWLCGNMMTTLL